MVEKRTAFFRNAFKRLEGVKSFGFKGFYSPVVVFFETNLTNFSVKYRNFQHVKAAKAAISQKHSPCFTGLKK